MHISNIELIMLMPSKIYPSIKGKNRPTLFPNNVWENMHTFIKYVCFVWKAY